MARRTLMQRDRELVDFEVNPETVEARIIDVANDSLVASLGLARKNGDQVLAALIMRRALSPMRKDKDDVLAAFGATLRTLRERSGSPTWRYARPSTVWRRDGLTTRWRTTGISRTPFLRETHGWQRAV